MHEPLRGHQLKSKLLGERSFPRKIHVKFGLVCRALWRRKAAYELALRIHKGVRACKNYIAGRRPPPGSAYVAILNEIENG